MTQINFNNGAAYNPGFDFKAVMSAQPAHEALKYESIPDGHRYLLTEESLGQYEQDRFQVRRSLHAEAAARQARLAEVRGEGLLLMELRHKRELRAQERAQAMLMLWATALVIVWVATAMSVTTLWHKTQDQSAVIHAQRQEMGGLRGQVALLEARTK